MTAPPLTAEAVLPISGDERAVEKYFGIKVRTLQDWRQRDEGPPYTKPVGLIIYLFDDVKAFLEARRHIPHTP